MASVIIPGFLANAQGLTIVRWYYDGGEFVSDGDELLEVMADDMTFTVIAESSGFLRDITVWPGDIVRVGDAIAELCEET